MKHAGTTAYSFQIELVMEALGRHPALGPIPANFTDVSVEEGMIVFREPLKSIMERMEETP